MNGCTVLHLAVQKNAPVELIEGIVNGGIDVNATDAVTLNTPLHYAVRDGASPEIVATLIRLGADVSKLAIVS